MSSHVSLNDQGPKKFEHATARSGRSKNLNIKSHRQNNPLQEYLSCNKKRFILVNPN